MGTPDRVGAQTVLEVEELEERIAPGVVGNPVPNGANPQPSGGGGHNNPVPNGANPQPR
jgi:hypothetical protein